VGGSKKSVGEEEGGNQEGKGGEVVTVNWSCGHPIFKTTLKMVGLNLCPRGAWKRGEGKS